MSGSNKNDEWEFSVDENSLASEDDSQEIIFPDTESQIFDTPQGPSLELEVRERKRMTRTQLADAMSDDVEIKTSYEYASFSDRFKAVVIDVIVLLMLVVLVYFLSFWQKGLFQSFGNYIYKDFSFLDFTSASALLLVSLYFLFFILPVVGSSKSPGKFFMKISCYSKGMKQLSMFQVLLREIIIKPISILSLIGVGIILFNSKKKGLHDYVCGTLVVRD